ncbi:glutathione S-transferase family protein [Kordiimonas laminariae]|uniref:glutathione S-transferase family protein n=1 Tax=Kordiimonas laminariae TaxID=2917717 RepID=UPI001FF4D1FA|nr:glutathione S-transferase C-terminal domain-containing protein [Kordiimonas laminariae]MCK0069463.1 glutathione S-transferase C-terminal domain-containing protein [Kordiimonas laminariae]
MPATLYHAPLACSLAARFAAAEGGVPLDIEYLNLRTKELEKGGSFLDVNPLGQVSVLKPEDQPFITETAATILWIQSQSENTSFRIDPSHPDYFQMIRWLGFCATELHKQIFRIVFYGEATDDVKDRIRDLAPQRFEFLDRHLTDRPYLLGDHFTAADAYLTWFFVLSDRAQLDASGYKNLSAYSERTLSRPLIAELIISDTAKDEAMNQQILPK